MVGKRARAALATLGLLGLLFPMAGCAREDAADVPWKVHVLLGFHGNFYHSWRGDTPDEAGFGTDIRVVREILRILDDANARGLDARGYWDTDHLFTYEAILPEHAPDIIEGIRRRVQAGLDEVLVMPYDNGLLHAMTEDEMRAVVRWSISNPWGSGLEDLFGTHTPVIRPQEMTLTTGSVPILREEGVEGVVLLYAGVPFNAFSSFVPPLPPAQRYGGVTRVRLRDEGPTMELWPAVSIGDIPNHVSFERWLLDLRELQTSGHVQRDLVLHVNADADGDFWLPQELPTGMNWIPNAGGLVEYIEAVNRHPWAVFDTPGRFRATHEPEGEVLIRQDLADGAFDGQYSWAEKFASHAIWSDIERARLAEARADALAADAPELQEELRPWLREGRDSSFFQRIRALSTTHFGMSTPIVNEERQAVAESIAAGARERAEAAERRAAEWVAAEWVAAPAPEPPPDVVYAFEVRDTRTRGPLAHSLIRLPLSFPEAPPTLRLEDGGGFALPHALLNPEALDPAGLAAELWTVLLLEPGERRRLHLRPAAGEEPPAPDGTPRRLANAHLSVDLDPRHGIAALSTGDWQAGGDDFVEPFITYRSDDADRVWRAGDWTVDRVPEESPGRFGRARIRTSIPFETPDGRAAARVSADLTLPPDAPWLVADVEVAYPYTRKRDVLHTVIQKLRRYLDLRWVEVAPFPLHPRLAGSRDRPLRVWKHNYLGVTSWYELDYGRINPANAELDAFNHHVTAGWVAVSDREHGLLVGQAADVRSSFAFAPMRLRERQGAQALWVNPFGSYHGRQLDYSHTGGVGLGAAFTELFSASLNPNGPSYNGRRERFSLLLAPYAGDEPPAELQADARAFFSPPAVVYLRSPAGEPLRLAAGVRAQVAASRERLARRASGPLPVPRAFLVNETAGAADVVWDPPPDPRIDGYEVQWREAARGADADWRSTRTGRARRVRVAPLEDGSRYAFRLRALGPGEPGPWTATREAVIGSVGVVEVKGVVGEMPVGLLLKTFWYALVHAFTT